jgi:urease accessory protein
MRTGLAPTITAALLLAPTMALAHTGSGDGFVHGLAHPFGGLDHVLAMVAVGIFAWQLGGRALWLVPATFVLTMTVGAMLVPLPAVEVGIAVSVVVLGAVIALGTRGPVAVAMGLVAVLALFHGQTHATEMPLGTPFTAYAAGFMLATALLHLGGLALGVVVGRRGAAFGRATFQVGGGLVAVAGVATLMQVT